MKLNKGYRKNDGLQMTKYKIFVIIDKKNKFWILIDNGKFIRNTTEEDLKGAKLKRYSITNTCDKCREEMEEGIRQLTDKSILYPGNARRDIDEVGKPTKKYVCKRHYGIDYQRYVPNSNNNIIKSLADRRIGNLRDEKQILADNCQELTCMIFCTEDLNKKLDNYSCPYDHSIITKGIVMTIGGKPIDLFGKIPQTKGRHYDPKYGIWNTDISNDYYKKFDILIFYCVSKDGNVIERMYIIPKEKMNMSISIVKNPIDRWGNIVISKYEQYRITDKEQLSKVNDIWKNIKNKNRRFN